MELHAVIKRPIVTEESMKNMGQNKYTFKVDPKANKLEIKEAVEKMFKVKVLDVNTISMPSKPKRRGIHTGRTAAWKKAIVTLKEGDKIEFFEGV